MNATIAIPVENDQVFGHFGKAGTFRIYRIESGKVASAETCDTGGAGHEDLALWLVTRSVNAVVCGGIGPGALGALAGAGIAVFAGVEGAADDAIARLIAGTLAAEANQANCARHSGGCGGHSGGGCGCHCGGRCHG